MPWLVHYNAPLDVIEGYSWGNEWPIGTYKHPPMQAWLLEIAAFITGRAEWAHFLLSQIATVTAFWAVWQTGRRITNETNALLGVMLLEGIIYFNFTTPEFNPNVLQTCFWSLIGWSFHRAIKENKALDWTLFGVFGAAGIYSKYSALLFLGVLTALLVAHPYSRQRLKSYGPYLSVAILLFLLSPHIKWLFDNNFQPFTYAESRAKVAPHLWQHITQTFGFALSQILAMGAAIVLFLVLAKGKLVRIKGEYSKSFDAAFLHTVTFAPIIILFALSLVIGMKLRGMWGASLWDFIGLWTVVNIKHFSDKRSLNNFYKAWISVFVLLLAIYAGESIISPALTGKGKRTQFPGQKMAETITETWGNRYNTPIEYVIGDTWLAGNLSFYSPSGKTPQRPHVFIRGDLSISQWIDLKDVKNNGGIIVWCNEHCSDPGYAQSIPSYLYKKFPAAEIQQPLTFAWQTSYPVIPVVMGWAIVPPEGK